MKKTAIATLVLSFAFAASGFAAGDSASPDAPNFDHRKAEVLKKLDDQIHNLQDAKTCVKAAKNPDDLKACREKQMIERKKLQEQTRRK